MPLLRSLVAKSRRPSATRQALRLAYANAGLWGVGSGLANVTLLTYLARELGASGSLVGWLIAAPALVGLLRLATPALVERIGSRRRFCIAAFLASASVLATLPWIAGRGLPLGARGSLVALGGAWAASQTLEYLGVAALWSWLGDLAPSRVRGRFIGRREAWLTGGAVVGTVLSVAATEWWLRLVEPSAPAEHMRPIYIACGLFGAALFALAALPLAQMPEATRRTAAATRTSWRDLVAPLADGRFRRLLVFGCYYSIANGLIQATQTLFMIAIGITYGAKKTLDCTSRGVQILLLPAAGRWADAHGNVRLLAFGQAIVAAAMLAFIPATSEARWWVAGAYILWLGWAAINVTLPNLMLGLSPPGESTAYSAAWFAWTQLAYAASALAGGWLLDVLIADLDRAATSAALVEYAPLLFGASWAMKSLAVPLGLRIPEPERT